jgi:hypothetical protein
MDFDLNQSLDLLGRTPDTLDRLLRGLPEEWTTSNEGPETWSPFDVVGHLIHGEETDWLARARIILDEGEGREFKPFDRYHQLEANRGKTLEELLDRFAERREKNLETLRSWNLTPADLDRRGRHPEFGCVTLRQLLATWVVHDLGHIGQIVRVLARHYGRETGPWKAYLPVLKPRPPV